MKQPLTHECSGDYGVLAVLTPSTGGLWGAIATDGDAATAISAPLVMSESMCWNGTNWQRCSYVDFSAVTAAQAVQQRQITRIANVQVTEIVVLLLLVFAVLWPRVQK